jgi:hypothetical protein
MNRGSDERYAATVFGLSKARMTSGNEMPSCLLSTHARL